MPAPVISQDPLYQLLRDEKVETFNKKKQAGESCELSGCDFRGLDLRGMDADGLDLSNAYFRGTDLRGIDFRNTNLEGASIAAANISGCYFPASLRAEEISMSQAQGTRLRCQPA